MTTAYDADIVAWSREQAELLRAGRLSALDIEHIADEVEDVGKSEQRELASRMALLLAHLLKWRDQPAGRSASWRTTIRIQRRSIERRLDRTPSLIASLTDADWLGEAWDDALAQAAKETGLASFPDACPWSAEQILDPEFLPE